MELPDAKCTMFEQETCNSLSRLVRHETATCWYHRPILTVETEIRDQLHGNLYPKYMDRGFTIDNHLLELVTLPDL